MATTKLVKKVMLFIYRTHNGEQQFYVLYRPTHPAKDWVVPIGHIGDNNPNETPKDAAIRELNEELGAEPISIRELDFKVETLLNFGLKRAVEQAFLIEVADNDYPFLEDLKITSSWHKIEELEKLLTYDSQFSAIPEIKTVLTI